MKPKTFAGRKPAACSGPLEPLVGNSSGLLTSVLYFVVVGRVLGLRFLTFRPSDRNRSADWHSKAVNLFDNPFADEFGVVEALRLGDFIDDHCVFG